MWVYAGIMAEQVSKRQRLAIARRKHFQDKAAQSPNVTMLDDLLYQFDVLNTAYPNNSFLKDHYNALLGVLFNEDNTVNFHESNLDRVATIIETCTPRAEQIGDDKDTVWSTDRKELQTRVKSLRSKFAPQNLHACLARVCATWVNLFLLITTDESATRRNFLKLMSATVGKMKTFYPSTNGYSYHYAVPKKPDSKYQKQELRVYPNTGPGKSIACVTEEQEQWPVRKLVKKENKQVLVFQHVDGKFYLHHDTGPANQIGIKVKGERVTCEEARELATEQSIDKDQLEDLFKRGYSIMVNREMMWASLCCGMLYQHQKGRR